MTNEYQLAQINIAKAIAPLDHPTMKGFVDQLDYNNELADKSPGFVWRLQTEDGDATAFKVFDDPLIIVNMSVWESLESLKAYVYFGDHVEAFKKRKNWFEKLDFPSLALWWVPKGQIPKLKSAKEKLELLKLQGPTPNAFTFTRPFPPQE
ncbi:DUF3291 domain-containing protein [Paenibacillus sp. GP183]|uniref:DUF3291 domain-containing protein n=1 Tax=Paenibacillus sp. GP183 TaxID=1882751 RepID=UPI000895B8C0|nr:DUF3291 domain-containing protein [Paenibacillus sp. GP183]SEC41724.1 protein of unknown function [Paenibacillus sp. GP183]